MNGDVQGDSFANNVEFTGYVKGVGTFNNVAFSGTFAPGLSPAVVTVGSIALGASSVLDMELGGTERGSEYDGIDIAGTMLLDGELKLSLLNGFTPISGNEWQLFEGPTTGMFASYDFPALADGIWRNGLGTTHAPADFGMWQANFGRSAGSTGPLVDAVPEPETHLLATILLGIAIAWRPRC
jgi:hypothetical protein